MKNNLFRFAKVAVKTVLASVVLLAFAQCDGMGGEKVNGTTVEVTMPDSMCRVFDFYGDDIVRVFQDPKEARCATPWLILPHRFSCLIPDAT